MPPKADPFFAPGESGGAGPAPAAPAAPASTSDSFFGPGEGPGAGPDVAPTTTPWYKANRETYLQEHPDSWITKANEYADEFRDVINPVHNLVGLAKGVGETAVGADNLVRAGLRAATSDEQQQWLKAHGFGIDPLEDKEGALQAKNKGEWVGKAEENVLEFMAGDAALGAAGKAGKASTVAKYSALQDAAKFFNDHKVIADLAHFGLTTLRQAALSGGQSAVHTGGDFQQAWDDFKTTGKITGVLGLLGLGGTGASALIRKSFTQGPELAAAEQAAETAAGSMRAEGHKVAENLGHVPGTSQGELVEDVQKTIKDVKTGTYQKYDQDMGNVLTGARGVPFEWKDSPVQKKAIELQGDSKVPAEIKSELDKLNPEKQKVVKGLLKRFGIGPAQDVTKGGMKKKYTWDEMEATRRYIGEIYRDLPDDAKSVGKVLRDLRDSIDDTFEQAAQKAGKPQLATQIKQVREDYFDKVSKWEDKSIAKLSGSHPNSVADILLNSEAPHKITNLRGLIGEQNMKPVEGGMFYKLLNDSRNADESFNPQKFLNKWANMSDDVKRAFWGENLPEVQEFVSKSMKNIAQTQEALRQAQFAVTAKKAASVALAEAPSVLTAAYGLWMLAGAQTTKNPSEAREKSAAGYHALFLGSGITGAIGLTASQLANPVIRQVVVKAMDLIGNPKIAKYMTQLANVGEKVGLPFLGTAQGWDNQPQETNENQDDFFSPGETGRKFDEAHKPFEGNTGVTHVYDPKSGSIKPVGSQ